MRSKKCLLVLTLLLLGHSLMQAVQPPLTGVISGTVIDAKLKEPLIGATVVIEGTTIGAVTDMDGNFRIESVEPGRYALVASYVSYQTQNIKDVAVEADREAVVSIEMVDAEVQLQDVVVVAQRRLGTETAVLNIVRESLPVVSGISSQQISRTQDSDAAEALRRIPGITIVDDRFVVVRGLAQRYNNVWLNNATTPSSETDSRAFSFDVLPSSLIDNMMVCKSPSAELPADFSGGFVRLRTKNVPEGNTFDVSYQMGFNTNATFRGFRLGEGYAADYVGFGAARRALPSDAPSHLNNVSASEAAAFTRRVNTGWGIRRFTALPEQKLSLTMNRLFDLGDWRIGNITNVNYSTGYDYSEQKNNNYLSYDMTNDRSSYRYKYDDVQYKNTTKIGALFGWSFIKGDNKIELHNFFSQRGTSSLTQRQGTDYYSEENVRKWESLYTGRTTYAARLSGEHKWHDDADKMDWTAGYAYAAYKEPDRKVVKSLLRSSEGEEKYYVSDPTRYYQDLADNSLSLGTNYGHTFTVSELFKPVLNAGIYGEYKTRDFSARRFVYNLLGNGYNRFAEWDYSAIFSDGNISADRIYMKESTNKSDDYMSDNLLGAAYVSMKLSYGEKLGASVGIRMEHYRLKLDGYESDGIKSVHLNQSSTEFFPSLNVAYSLTEKQQVRVAYGRSVNRPEFREIVPYVYYDFALDANITGNVDLKNAYVHNADLRYELYPSQGETVSIGAFYKHFADPIEQTYREAGSGLQYTYHNAERAEAFGVEVDVKKHLDFVGLKGLSLVFNGAYIHSKVYFPEGSFERDRAMQGQSPYLINMGLFYQNDEKRLSASVLYNRTGKRIETVGVPAQNPNDDIPDIYEMPRNSLDLSFTKTLGRYVELKAGIKDLLNSKIEYKQFLTLTEEDGAKREVEQPVRSYRRGVTLNIGATVRF